jgi:hypothetical protein
MFVYALVSFVSFSKDARVTQFLDRLGVIDTFLVRHGNGGGWVGVVIVLVIILLSLPWFAIEKHPEDGRCGCTDLDKRASLQAKIQELLRKWEPTGPPN